MSRGDYSVAFIIRGRGDAAQIAWRGYGGCHHDAHSNAHQDSELGILAIIPPKANRRDPAPCDFRRYRDHNHVERLFNRLKQSRRIATRYNKIAASFLGRACSDPIHRMGVNSMNFAKDCRT